MIEVIAWILLCLIALAQVIRVSRRGHEADSRYIATALDDFEDRYIRHRDIRPSNKTVVTATNFAARHLLIDAFSAEKKLLTQEELNAIAALVGQFNHVRQPLAPALKSSFHRFTALSGQYKTLLEKLNVAQLALKTKQDIDDEVITLSTVEKPIVLLKLYQRERGWYVVPSTSYITCKEGIFSWLSRSPKHPVQNDSFLTPALYNGMPTRYVWHELTQECIVTPELTEAATSLRGQLQNLQVQLEEVSRQGASVGLAAHSIFEPAAELSAVVVEPVSGCTVI